MIVKRVNIHDAKTNLSRIYDILLKPRIGAAAGKFAVPDSFFDPLPDEIIKAFSGK